MPSSQDAGELYIGLMSGTSVDGVDAALVRVNSTNELTVIETDFTPFKPSLREQINYAAQNNSDLFKNEDSELHTQLADVYANACVHLLDKTNFALSDITSVANHGQTVKHEPNATPPYSLQLGDGQRLANILGVKTICQFRQADLAVGGQGAPLMPAFHSAVFGADDSNTKDNRFVLNIGGIANVTQLNAPVVGFDTGPGNTLMDQWIEHHLGKSFDDNGAWAASGTAQSAMLNTLMQAPYLRAPYPKSTGTDVFNLAWLNSVISNIRDYAPQDVQATLLAFTVKSIALALQQLKATQGAIYVCGGGARNTALMTQIKNELGNFDIKTTDDLGVPSDWLEAVGFAWLGYCYMHNIESNLPSVTGANNSVVLGQLFSPQG